MFYVWFQGSPWGGGAWDFPAAVTDLLSHEVPQLRLPGAHTKTQKHSSAPDRPSLLLILGADAQPLLILATSFDTARRGV